MRLKKIKDADKILANSSFVINNPEDYKNKWNEVFGNDNKICLEIGMGKGDFIVGMAKMHPDINFIGVEKYPSVQYKALAKLEEAKITNVKLISFDAADIENIFNREIDSLYLNFSDPWHKNRHEKRRLTHSNFLSKYDSIFKEDYKIIQKTDNRPLFEFSVKSITDYGYKIDDISLDLYSTDLKGNVATEYEKKFQSKGSLIYKAEFIKKGN